MGFYFERATKNLLDAFQEHNLEVSVWNGQKVIKTTSNKLSFTFSHADVDDMFRFSSVTYVLTKTDLFSNIPTIFSNSNSNRIVTYIIPENSIENLKIEPGPNSNRIICLDDFTMKQILKKIIPVI